MVAECGTKRAMDGRRGKRAQRPLDRARLDELALRYVGRYATTRSKLVSYLKRKLRERGWDGEAEPDPAAIAERLSRLSYIDDRAFALARASAHSARGLGQRRLAGALRSAGVGEDDGADALRQAAAEAFDSALRYARRRRLGPFAIAAAADRKARDKAIAAMARAGHRFEVAAAIVDLPQGNSATLDDALEELRERFAFGS